MVLLPVVGGVVGFVYSENQEPVYQAKATLLVQQRRGTALGATSDFTVSRELATTYARLVSSTPFLDEVEAGEEIPLTSSQLKGMVTATVGANPPLLEIGVRSSDPALAATVANVVSREFIEYVVNQRLAEIARLQAAAASQGIGNIQDLVSAQFSIMDSLFLLEPVTPPTRPIVPRTEQNITLGVVVGLVLAAGGALLLEGMGDTVRFGEDVTRRFGVPTLGTVFRWMPRDVGDTDLVLWSNPTSAYAESFRQIRANFQFASVNAGGNSFLVCSPGPGEGKSTVVCNLAIALAQMGKRVALVDGDLRRASIHRRFRQVERQPGLSNYLADLDCDLATALRQSEIQGVDVIPSGPNPPNPAELLGSPKMAGLLERLKADYDYVLVDSPPTLLVADASVLAAQVDGCIVVVDAFKTRSASLRAAIHTLRNSQVSILGVVLNKLKRSRFGYGYNYPYYYYYYSTYDGYYAASEADRASNGVARAYQRPLRWLRAAVSRRGHRAKQTADVPDRD